MKNKIIGITGASGIIGSKLCENLVENGYIINILTRNPNNFNKNPKIKIFKMDLLNPNKKRIQDFTKGITYLFHLASELLDESKMMVTNYYSTKILVDSIKNKNIIFIYLSSIGVFDFNKSNLINEDSYKKQYNIYEKTKFLSEKYLLKSCRENNLKFIIVRPSIIIDVNMKSKIIDYLVIFIRMGINIKFSKKIIANFIILDDLVKTILKIFENEKALNDSFNVSSDILLEEFLLSTKKVLNSKTYIRLPYSIFFNLISLVSFFRKSKKTTHIKSFFSNTSKICTQKVEPLIGNKLSLDYFNFLKNYVNRRK